MKTTLIVLLALFVLIAAMLLYARAKSKDVISPEENLVIKSSAFDANGLIPVQYTGYGEDISPPLELGSLLPNAKTIAIVMDDIDHPMGNYNHWVIWNIPATGTSIPQAISRDEMAVSLGNAVQGKSHYGGKHYYRGPRPPFGVHRYIFKVYVLDIILELDHNAGKADLQKAMENHILQYGTLTGLYGKR